MNSIRFALLLASALIVPACGGITAPGNTPLTASLEHYGCGYAVQKINEAQSVAPIVSWGCIVNSITLDPDCLKKVISTEIGKISTEDDRRHFVNLAWCINLKCHAPIGDAWTNDACAQQAFTTTCEKQQTLCFGD